jgi:hypothetical protein
MATTGVIFRKCTQINGLATTMSEDVSTSRAAQTRLPTELIYIILAISIGDYIGDMMLNPLKILKWDAILMLLHVSRTFRLSTIQMMYHLWGETFIQPERTRYLLSPLAVPWQFH